MFEDQINAADILFDMLPSEQLKSSNFLLVCLSLEGVAFCNHLASKLDLDYELFFSAGIMAPNNPECEIACVGESEEIVLNDALITCFGITQDFVYGQAKRVYEEKVLKQVYKYRKGNLLSFIKGRNILLVNDGCESGAKLTVAAKSMASLGAASISLACAVMPESLAISSAAFLDFIYCAKKAQKFVNTAFYYKTKLVFSESEVLKILEESPHYLPLQKVKEQSKEQNKEQIKE